MMGRGGEYICGDKGKWRERGEKERRKKSGGEREDLSRCLQGEMVGKSRRGEGEKRARR